MLLFACDVCKQKMFYTEEDHRERVKIKRSGTNVKNYDLRNINLKIKGPYKKVNQGKIYFFDVIKSEHNIIKIMCPKCKKFYLIDLDDWSWKRVNKNYWPVA